MTENEISKIILTCAFKVHSTLGPGLLESAYRECLYHELTNNGLKCIKEKPMPIVYGGIKLDHGYRIDLLVEDKVVIEIKCVEALNDVHFAQTRTYLKFGNYKLGMVLNFHVVRLKDGIKRIVNGL
jgi:GxxExxY protein